MKLTQLAVTSLAAAATATLSSAASISSRADNDTTIVSSVQLGKYTYENHGLVAFGRLSHAAKDKYGESLGGLGSAIALESFKAKKGGSYDASIRLQPDRGHNQGGAATSDYRARSHSFDLSFTPLDKNAKTPAAENVKLTYRDTLLYKFGANYTTGLDPDATREWHGHTLPSSTFNNHLPTDTEGLVIYQDHLFVSDEYGPNIFVISRLTGQIESVIQPPSAIIPEIRGHINFTALTEPDTGRAANAGFEGLTFDEDSKMLWALLQTATNQDGGKDKTTSSHTRLLGWKIRSHKEPKLKYEYVVTLPVSKKGKTRGSSELHFVRDDTFLVLARDGNGFGDSDSESSYKNAALINTDGATNLAGSKYDDPSNPVAPNGQLVAGIKDIKPTDFVDFVDESQLAKFGLRADGAFDENLIASKLESLALTSTQDRHSPNDYFLITVSDNDFITTQGAQAGQVNGTGEYVLQNYQDPYALQYGSQDTQVFVYRLTVSKGKGKKSDSTSGNTTSTVPTTTLLHFMP